MYSSIGVKSFSRILKMNVRWASPSVNACEGSCYAYISTAIM
jgi:hypothetical protein